MATVGTLNINFATNVAKLISDMGKASNSVKTTSDKISRSLSVASRALKGFIVTAASIQGLKTFATVSGDMAMLSGRIQNATRDAQEFRQAFDGLNRIAASTGGSLATAVDVFQRLSFTRNEIGATVDEMLRFTETVSKLGIVSGAGTAALDAGLMQLGQSLSAGIVRAEEFNSIMENIPMVGKAIADEFGISTGQLRLLVLEGKVLSEDVFAAILNQSAKADENFAKLPMTVQRASAESANALSIVTAELDRSLHISDAIIVSINKGTAALKWMAVAAVTVADSMNAIVKAADIAGKNLDIGMANIYNRFSDKHGGQIGGIKLGRFDTSEREQQVRELTDATASLHTGRDVYEKLFPSQNDLANQSTSVRIIKTDYEALAKSLGSGSEAAEKAAKKSKKALEDFNYTLLTTKSRTDDFYNSLIDHTIDAGNSMESWRNIAIGALKDFAKELLHVGNAGQSSGSIGGFLAQQVIGAFSGGLYSMSSSGVPIPGHKPAIPTRDVGGPVSAGKGYKVGVPEIFFPSNSGTAVPLENMGGDTFYIDARGADATGLARLESMIRSINGSIERRALAAVQDQRKRSGAFLQ